MKITSLQVDGFGVWSGLSLAELSPGVNAFYGPNEAGKTTLMQFVRSVFFGYSAERRARYLPPLHPGRPGGTIAATRGLTGWSVSRHWDTTGTPQLLVSAAGQATADDEHALATLLGDIDEATFTNVFVCGLREIQELATLSDTQAAEELYSLALGLDRVSLTDVVKELDASRKRLLCDDERPSMIVQLVGQRDRLQGEIDDLHTQAPRYLALSSERRQLDAEITALERETLELEEHERQVVLARSLTERWQRRAAVAVELEACGNFGTLPVDALARYERTQEALAQLQRRMRKLKRRRGVLRREIDALKINDALGRHAPRLEALAEQQHWIESLEKQIAQLDNDLLELQLHEEQGRKDWGGSGAMRALGKRDIDELRNAARELRNTRQQAQSVHQQHSSTDEQQTALKRQIESALGTAKDKGLNAALAEAGQLVADLRRRVQLDERIAQMSTREAELAEQGHEHLEEQILPTWVLAGLGSLFVLGCALVLLFLAGLVLPASLGESLGWPVGAIGIAAAAAAGLIKFTMDRNASGRLDKCHQQIGVVSQQLEQAKLERDELDERLPRGGGPLVARLQAAEKSLARLEALLPLQGQLDATSHDAKRAADQAESLRDRCKQARKRWLQLLTNHGLPADLPPGQLKAFARGRQHVAGLAATIAEKKSELARRKQEYETLSGRVKQVVAQCNLEPRSHKPVDQLHHGLTALGEQQRLHKQRAELQSQIGKLRSRYVKLSRSRAKWRKRRLWLLRAAGTLDEREFRRRAGLEAQRDRLQAEHARLEQEILAVLNPAAGRDQVVAWLTAAADLAQLETRAVELRRVATSKLSTARERRGALVHEIKLLVDDRQLVNKRTELDLVERRLADAIERWRVLATCGLVLEAVREYYEREHQPQALKEASAYLARLTAGRYVRVWTPLGEHALVVDDAAGQPLPVEVLSSGTREQLFLALRLALVKAYARRGIELPLVLDDVLVNFDVHRAKAAALVLRDFAREGHQVLIFTCHEHIARLFRHVKADVRHLPDRLQGNAPIDADFAPRRVRREPEPIVVELEPEPVTVEPEPAEPEPVEVAPETFEIEPVVIGPVVIEAVEPIVVEQTWVEPAPVVFEQPPPAPKPTPVAPAPRPRRPRRRLVHATERVQWNAEEFDGELSDRVRRDIVWEEVEFEDDTRDDWQAA